MRNVPIFFESPTAMRAWLQKHHAAGGELIVGYYKAHIVAAGQPSLTWAQSVAEALCYGWIDGVRHSLGADRYTIRFTPRRATSRWSAINIRLVGELEAAGRMTDAGRRVFEARKDHGSDGYQAQKKLGSLAGAYRARLDKNKAAAKFFSAQPPGYQRMMAWWVMQAKQEETRMRRLERLIRESASGKRLM